MTLKTELSRVLRREGLSVALLIAAAAELNQRTVLYLDKDFELIAELTGQPTELLRVS